MHFPTASLFRFPCLNSSNCFNFTSMNKILCFLILPDYSSLLVCRDFNMFSCFKPKPKSINCHISEEVSEIQLLDDPDVAERDPSGRYIRSDEILGRGECKIVYKAFDEVDGIEVAWNQVRIDDQKLVRSPEDLVRLYTEVSLLKSLKHENVIKCYCSWVNVDLNHTMTVNMITELFTSGDLRQYRRKHKNVDVKAIKNWARQVLRGLHYLHSHDPPIIHRDLQGDNIFINGNTGRVKIGDLGLAVVMRDQPTADCSFIGTPEFMAPELYKEDTYNQLVDIYSFGMCMLEMATCEYPYSECKIQSQISAEVISGLKPASLAKVTDPEVKQFIEKCLLPASMRSSAAKLLNDPFLTLPSPGVTSTVVNLSSSSNVVQCESVCLPAAVSQPMDIDSDGKESSSTAFSESNSEAIDPATVRVSKTSNTFSFTLLGKEEDCSTMISMNLRIMDQSGDSNNIDFTFDLQKDTSVSIAGEMVDELNLPNEDAVVISEIMDELMGKLSTGHCKRSCAFSSSVTNTDDPQLPLPQHMKAHKDAHESFTSACSSIVKASSSGTSDNLSALSSISPLALDDVYYQCNELKMELYTIDVEYEQRKAELMRMRVEAIENAKRKWAAGKSPVT